MTGSGDNLIIIANIVVVQNQEQALQAIHICFGANGRQLPAWNKTTSGLLSLWSLSHVT